METYLSIIDSQRNGPHAQNPGSGPTEVFHENVNDVRTELTKLLSSNVIVDELVLLKTPPVSETLCGEDFSTE